ncbi:glycoside hydrolase family 43 protein [Kitasatospora arboriphila]
MSAPVDRAAPPHQDARNPVLPGFHPDPSVCRVGEDYYLVTSSFEYFPGLPLFHSRDLAHWRPIGHAVDRPGQLALDGVRPSGGLYAASLHHARGRFHLVCTLVDGLQQDGTFLLTADDPAGAWSDPVWLPGAPGFDPSLFFDDDGSAHLLGTRPTDEEGRTEIWLRGIDLDRGVLTGEEHVLFRGALVDARWAEGPHLYRHEDHYVLVLAEGGTEHDHAVTVARSRRLTGPYRNNPRNPVLTHRHLGIWHPVTGAGHADLVRTPAATGTRCCSPPGRTAAAGTPTSAGRPSSPGSSGRTAGRWSTPAAAELEESTRIALPPHPWPEPGPVDHFDAPELGPHWSLLRTPRAAFHSLDERPGHLRLRLLSQTLAERVTPSFVGRRQQHADFTAEAALDFAPAAPGEQAGLVAYYDPDHHVRLLVDGDGTGGRVARLTVRDGGRDTVRAELPLASGPLVLGAVARGQQYTFRCGPADGPAAELGTVDGRILSSRHAGGFTGCHLGLYATAPYPTATRADFDWFRYAGA